MSAAGDPGSSSSASKRRRTSEPLADAADDGDGERKGASRSKRQRVSRACDQCRLSREKCNGLRPICQSCIVSSRPCTYATNSKKRGFQPGYIRALELSLAWLFSQDIGAEQLLNRQLATDASDLQKALSAKSTTDSEPLHHQWVSSIVCKRLEHVLSGGVNGSFRTGDNQASSEQAEQLFPSPDQIKNMDSEYEASSRTDSNQRRTSETHLPTLNTPDTIQTQVRNSSLNAFSCLSEGSFVSSSVLTAPDKMQLPTNFWKLLDIYYAYTHSWLPMSEKNDILKTAYSYRQADLTVHPGSDESGMHAELWAILTLASHQSPGLCSQSEQVAIFSNARRLVPLEEGSFNSGHVRALLLIALMFLGRRDWVKAWMHIGTAVRIALYLGLHVSDNFTRSKHTMLACFVLDTVTSMYLKKPVHLTADFISRIGRLDEDGLEEWTPWEGHGLEVSRQPARSLSTFNALVQILRQPQPVSDNAMWTRNLLSDALMPQELHVELISVWAACENGQSSSQTLTSAAITSLTKYSQVGGALAIQPTLVALFENVISNGHITLHGGISSSNSVTDLLNMWGSPVAGQAPQYGASSSKSSNQPAIGEMGYAQRPMIGYQTADVLQSVRGINPSLPPSVPAASTSSQQAPDIERHAYNTESPVLKKSNNSALLTTTLSQRPDVEPSELTVAEYAEQFMPDFFSDIATSSADFDAAFEEMAILDGSRHGNDGVEFMQNLGVGPDLDLAAFFGADYQASDPMLAYLQPGGMSYSGDQNDAFPGS